MANKNNKGYNMSNQYNEFLSKDKTDVIRGIAIISIILYHLTISGISNLLLFPFQFMQFCGVATFFLLSGYALMEQYQSRKNYLNGFLLKKLSRIYFSYILMFIPYLIYELCINSKINWIEELLGILTVVAVPLTVTVTLVAPLITIAPQIACPAVIFPSVIT